MVRQECSVSGQAQKNRDSENAGARNKTRWLTRRAGNRQTENTGINTLGIMDNGLYLEGVETSTKTGETHHGVTPINNHDIISQVFLFTFLAHSCLHLADLVGVISLNLSGRGLCNVLKAFQMDAGPC
jgi:hypothetical protein